MDAATWLPDIVMRAEESSSLQSLPKPVLYLLALFCLSMAAIVAGLTLGLMSLDMVGLEILQNSKNEKESTQARRIAEIRQDGNLLLVTLLLTNTIAMELLPLVLDSIFPGSMVSLFLSVVLVMLFGEIIPQAVCSRHALDIGYRFVDLVKVLRFILYPVAKPIAFCLDRLLGVEMGQIYTREELKGLVDVHNRNKYGVLTTDETSILKGALDLESKKVSQIMTKAENVFMLDVEGYLNRESLKSILHYGHSRVPIYMKDRANVVGLLLTKQLILIDPDDEIPIRAMFNKKRAAHKIRVAPPVYVSQNVPVHELLNEFQSGRSHLAIVYDDVGKRAEDRVFLGIVTLEDIIEEILQEEIVDETDVYVDNTSRKPVLTRNKEGRLVRATVQTELLTASRLKGTKHIIIREIDMGEIKKPIRDGLESTYGATSSEPSESQKIINPIVPNLVLEDEEHTAQQSLKQATGVTDAVYVDMAASKDDLDVETDAQLRPELWSSNQQLESQPSTQSAVQEEEDRPTTAPPRVEYDDDGSDTDRFAGGGDPSSASYQPSQRDSASGRKPDTLARKQSTTRE